MGFFSDFKQGLKTSVALSTGLDEQHLFYSHTNGPEPSGVYCAMNILRINPRGMPYTTSLAYEETLHVSVVYEIDVKFSFYGQDSGDHCTEFSLTLNNGIYREEFKRNNISVMSAGPIEFAPDKRGTKWTNRYTLTGTFAIDAGMRQDVDIIETVIYTDYQGNTNTITIP